MKKKMGCVLEMIVGLFFFVIIVAYIYYIFS